MKCYVKYCKNAYHKECKAFRFTAAQIQGSAAENNANTIVVTMDANEKTPLLGGSWKPKSTSRMFTNSPYGYNGNQHETILCCDFRVLGIVMLLAGGLTIATYLLVTESRLPSASFALDLVNRDVWSQAVIPLGRLLNDSKIMHILVVQTGGKICSELYSCMDILRDLQKTQDAEINYNFLIGSDGQTYEARGWNYESGLNLLPQQSSLVIGFIGNYTFVPPTDVQCTSALSIVNESLQRKKLHNSYQVFGLRNLSISHFDGEALFNRISKWQRFVTLLHVL